MIRKGDSYGRNNILIHRDESNFGPMVEFYDMVTGQFVSRYYIDTLTDSPHKAGLNLHGGVDVWSLDAPTMDLVRNTLENWKLDA